MSLRLWMVDYLLLRVLRRDIRGWRKVAIDRVVIHVEGLGWKPKPNDLKKYSIMKLIDKLRREIEG